MSQLVKGGKYAYAWVNIRQTGSMTIPPEAVQDYRLEPDEIVVLIPGSKGSGGFSVVPQRNIKDSPLNPLKNNCDVQEDKVQVSHGKPFTVTRLEGERVNLPMETLEAFGIEKGDRLLAVRGSGMGPSFLVKGPIKEEALKHPELEEF